MAHLETDPGVTMAPASDSPFQLATANETRPQESNFPTAIVALGVAGIVAGLLWIFVFGDPTIQASSDKNISATTPAPPQSKVTPPSISQAKIQPPEETLTAPAPTEAPMIAPIEIPTNVPTAVPIKIPTQTPIERPAEIPIQAMSQTPQAPGQPDPPRDSVGSAIGAMMGGEDTTGAVAPTAEPATTREPVTIAEPPKPADPADPVDPVDPVASAIGGIEAPATTDDKNVVDNTSETMRTETVAPVEPSTDVTPDGVRPLPADFYASMGKAFSELQADRFDDYQRQRDKLQAVANQSNDDAALAAVARLQQMEYARAKVWELVNITVGSLSATQEIAAT